MSVNIERENTSVQKHYILATLIVTCRFPFLCNIFIQDVVILLHSPWMVSIRYQAWTTFTTTSRSVLETHSDFSNEVKAAGV
jgi:hypothetical protein